MTPQHSLVWIDLEMTGLDATKDVILEIATIITDNNLKIIEKGPAFVIHQPEEKLISMDEWCTQTHKKSGLTDAVRASIVTLTQAEDESLKFIKKHCGPKTGVLCGNSVWQDRIFLKAYMPRIIDYLHYRLVDVSSIKELIAQWYPNNPHTTFIKKESHRAYTDIKESIAELHHYKKQFFAKN